MAAVIGSNKMMYKLSNYRRVAVKNSCYFLSLLGLKLRKTPVRTETDSIPWSTRNHHVQRQCNVCRAEKTGRKRTDDSLAYWRNIAAEDKASSPVEATETLPHAKIVQALLAKQETTAVGLGKMP
eukprot:gnl/TRDRNA2_/TRDRNA2_77855_c0_seq1.p1 gnl/TRDRNA2_/TRDRNA2_77855_c0~~gnl/TRDRNA2_/TRDRNA2_77855_c0_seq1.p1  ORF type:complete len:125 (-),score=17.22 gnl/TRDRNA2_/TRDRNA2_77855_c0_seq1:314-688(-)